MKTALKKFFLPHEHNNYHPHILHTKRAIFYTAFFVIIKVILIIFVLSLPDTVFVLPDVLAPQEEKLISLANDLRIKKGLPTFKENVKLTSSALLKSTDMAKGQYFSHTGPNGEKLSYYLKQVGYPYAVAGENLAMGFTDTEELFQAWVNSPTHYANLVDSDFEETGIALSAGSYDNIPTIYVTEHFGRQKKVELTAETAEVKEDSKSEAIKSVAGNTEETAEQENVSSKEDSNILISLNKTSEQQEEKSSLEIKKLSLAGNVVNNEESDDEIKVEQEKSYLAWSEDSNGNLRLSVRAFIHGSFKSAVVEVGNYTIPLSALGYDDRYVGEISTNQKTDEFFKVIFPPIVKITTAQDEVIEDSLSWLSIKVVNPATFEKYTLAKKTLGPITGIFNFVNELYLGFIGLFAMSLILAISFAKEMHKKHPHIIPQTLGLIGLLILFWMM